MSQLIEVAFKGNRREFYLWPDEAPPPLKAAVIVDADRGEDLGRVHSVGDAARLRYDGTPHGRALGEATKSARRLATAEEVRRERELRTLDEDARRRSIERVKANNLVMKVSDAEWQWDRKKLTLYFTAEKRVDFRTLVRELAAMFRTRIELKQIGVRDEAKRLDGVGRCGRQYCSSSWLPELRPVNLGVAKDQRLSLNPSQISGACGRLMCCLRYEHEFYVQARKRFPKEGKVLRTRAGEAKVVANDIFRERVTLRAVDGEMRVVPLAELREEVLELGGEPSTVGAWVTASATESVSAPAPRRESAVPAPSRDPEVAVFGSPDSTVHAGAQEVVAEDEEAEGEESGDEVAQTAGESGAESGAENSAVGEQPRRPRRRGRRGGRRNRARGNRDAGGGADAAGNGDASGPAAGGSRNE